METVWYVYTKRALNIISLIYMMSCNYLISTVLKEGTAHAAATYI